MKKILYKISKNMKKILIFLSLIVCAFFVGACKEVPIISYAHNYIDLALNENFEIKKTDIDVSNGDYDLSYLIVDENIAVIEEDVIKPIGEGETFLKIYLTNTPEVFVMIGGKINHKFLTENASVTRSNININIIENANYINKVIIDEKSDEVPQILYDSNIIDYDYKSGLITAKNVGSTEVVVNYKKCSTTFVVCVTSTIYATYMNAEDVEVFANSKGQFKFSIFPENANAYRFFTNDATLKVSPTGEFEILKNNNALVHYYFYTAEGIRSATKTFRVSVINPIKDIDVKITDTEGNIPTEYIQGNIYRIYLNIDTIEDTKIFFSSSITLTQWLTPCDEGYFAQFKFNASGDLQIVIDYSRTLMDYDNILKKVIDVEVSANVGGA